MLIKDSHENNKIQSAENTYPFFIEKSTRSIRHMMERHKMHLRNHHNWHGICLGAVFTSSWQCLGKPPRPINDRRLWKGQRYVAVLLVGLGSDSSERRGRFVLNTPFPQHSHRNKCMHVFTGFGPKERRVSETAAGSGCV